MVQETSLISLGELLAETGETENDNEILERLKLLARERMPEGWMSWKVTQRSKEDIFGDSVDPQIITKLSFALPKDSLARVFVPESTHLSEMGFRDLKLKMLDWAFARALITSPPAICNKIRGSPAATELFNEAVRAEKSISGKEVNRALPVELDGETTGTRRRHDDGDMSSDSESDDDLDTRSKRSRIDALEQRMVEMFSIIREKIESFNALGKRDGTQDISFEQYSSEEDYPPGSSRSESADSWRAPSMGFEATNHTEPELPEIDILPNVDETDPNISASSERTRAEGIAVQQFGSEAWNCINYMAVKKRFNPSQVFSGLKLNVQLRGQEGQMSRMLAKQDGIFRTIIHGLLCQQKALAEDINKLEASFPSAAEHLRKLLSEGSDFKVQSDNLMQYVCAHRAEIIEMRRRLFKTRSEILTSMLQQIPPSQTYLFHEEKLSEFIRENGGVSQIFPTRFGKALVKKRRLLKQSRQSRHSGTTHTGNRMRIQPNRTLKRRPGNLDQRERRR